MERSEVRAVRTTGIYCRPECAARPDPSNVTTYPLAAAAEAAGFRACHRCRPYRSGVDLGVVGTDLVCRAVRMISAGHLDTHREDDLAAELGVSPRHLRRVFNEELGVTPDGLARSARTHFARRLLDDTDLPVAQVAFAAGFGSVRQLQRACANVFGAPPAELRSRRRAADRLVADGGLRLRLAYPGQLDWVATRRWLADRSLGGVEVAHGEEKAQRWARTIEVDGDPALIELGALPGEQALELAVHLPHWQGLTHIVAAVRTLVGIDSDQRSAVDALGNDPVVGPSIAANPGLRTPGTWSAWESTLRAVVGQQVSVAAARSLATRICRQHGTPVAGLGPLGLDRLFPTPGQLAAADLGSIGLTTTRARTVQEVARFFRDLPPEASGSSGAVAADPDGSGLLEALGAIRGVGGWTTEYVALRLGHADAFPSGDLGLREAWARLTGEARPSPTELRRIAEAWRPWRAFAATHLWNSLNGGAAAQKSRVK